ncbi:MAG: hypothetical protein LBV67_07895 [Streptococcaceae bacterium]|jgi:hypothetical protein|nr:hypothetical protein [Streptococcaceae bacterium]
MSKKGIILLIIGLAGILFILVDYSKQADVLLNKEQTTSQKVSSNPDVLATKEVFEKSIQASNEEDVESYIKLLIPKARENTKKELTKFFKDYEVENELQSFEVLKHEGNHLLAKAVVQSVNLEKNQKKYKDNTSTLNVTFIKEENQWLIELTTTIDTQFLK